MNDKISNEGVKIGRGHCGIYSAAYVTGKQVEDVFDDYRRMTGKTKRFRGRTYEQELIKLIQDYGVKLEKQIHTKQSLRKWFDDSEYQIADGTFVVYTTGHVQIADNGHIIDQTGMHKVEDFWGRNKIVKSVYKVVNTKTR